MRILSNSFYADMQAHDVVSFDGNRNDADDFNIAQRWRTFDEVVASLPAGWVPDLVLFHTPLYNPVPAGIEHAPWPTAVIVDDWFGGVDYLPDTFRCFDVVVASDRLAEGLLRSAGFDNVCYWPAFGHSPDRFYCDDTTARDIDVSFAGNLSFNVQFARLHWIERILLLDPRHVVQVADGLFGAGYRSLLNRSKIVFNRTFKGEMNARVFEATACGALLFVEEDNREIREFLTPGKEVILFNAENLEERIDWYLGHDDERQAIAAAGRRRIARLTYAQLYERLLADVLAMIGKGSRRSPNRRSYANSATHRSFVQALFTNISPQLRIEGAARLIAACCEERVALNDAAVALLSAAVESFQKGDHETAMAVAAYAKRLLDQVIASSKTYVTALYNRAEAAEVAGDAADARERFLSLTQLESTALDDLAGAVHPFTYAMPLRTLWSDALVTREGETRNGGERRSTVLRAMAFCKYSGYCAEPAAAAVAVASAHRLMPEVPYFAGLALLHDALDDPGEILAAAGRLPVSSEIWVLAATALMRSGNRNQAVAYAQNRLLMASRLQCGVDLSPVVGLLSELIA